MKLFVRINKPASGAMCQEHPDVPAVYEMELSLFGQKFAKPSCAACLCRHFNIQTIFSIERGLELPEGLRHGSV